jgi:hypothetical protein
MIHESGGLTHGRGGVEEMELDRAVFRHTVTAEGRITFKPATHEHEQLPRERVTATVLQKKFDILGCRA